MYTTCRVGVLSSEISKHSKISPPPSLRSHLTSSPMGVLSGDYGIRTDCLMHVSGGLRSCYSVYERLEPADLIKVPGV